MNETEEVVEIFYHASNGIRIKPEVMGDIHLTNAIKALERKGETDAPVYSVMVKELEKRRSKNV